MAETSVVQRALAECWAGEVSGVTYYEALGERFPEHRHEADVLALSGEDDERPHRSCGSKL